MDTPCFMMMLGSFNNFLMVYRDVRLVWAARTQVTPIFVDVGTFSEKQGLIVTLSDSGFLSVSYLGTEQLSTNAQALSLKDQKKIDYASVNKEHSKLIQQIRTLEENRVDEPTDSLQISCQLTSRLEATNEYIEDPKHIIARNEMQQVLRAKLKISLSYQAGSNPISATFKFVQVVIEPPKTGVFVEQQVFRFENLSFVGSSTPNVIQTYIYPTSHDEPTNNKVNVTLTYSQIRDPSRAHGTLRSTTNSFKLSFPFFCTLLPEGIKNEDNFKTQLNLDKKGPSCYEIFKDFFDQQQLPSALQKSKTYTFKLHNQSKTTVMMSKDDLKYRVQSENPNSLQMLLTELYNRCLNPKYDHVLSTTDKMPTQELFAQIDRHFAWK